MKFKRRAFLSGAAAATGVVAATPARAEDKAGPTRGTYMTLIDLTKCDGCEGRDTPACVESCRTGNAHKFPKPDKSKIKPYWPQKKFEDWSDKQHVQSRLTPFNWLFVQQVEVDGEMVAVPRRCMHCDNPPCAKLCPFGINQKHKDGAVTIDPSLCFGGAKCRTVCPWNVPQRQAGVGVYTHLQPMPVGGGVMYKCDLCKDRLDQGKKPHCVTACPRGAMKIGLRKDIIAAAKSRAKEIDGHIYGLDEHGGTSTLYVSKVPFDKIDQAILASEKDPKKAMRMHQPDNVLEQSSGLAQLSAAAPVAGMATAFLATMLGVESKTRKKPQPTPKDAADEQDGGAADEK